MLKTVGGKPIFSRLLSRPEKGVVDAKRERKSIESQAFRKRENARKKGEELAGEERFRLPLSLLRNMERERMAMKGSTTSERLKMNPGGTRERPREIKKSRERER